MVILVARRPLVLFLKLSTEVLVETSRVIWIDLYLIGSKLFHVVLLEPRLHFFTSGMTVVVRIGVVGDFTSDLLMPFYFLYVLVVLFVFIVKSTLVLFGPFLIITFLIIGDTTPVCFSIFIYRFLLELVHSMDTPHFLHFFVVI